MNETSTMNSHPTELILHDVRCFHGEQQGSISPITLLVGENSTGKTTFLGCYSVLHRLFSKFWDFDQRLDFNEEPFSMGSYRNIVSSSRGPTSPLDQFKLGLVFSPQKLKQTTQCSLMITFSAQGSQPVVSSMRFQFNEQSFLEFKRDESGETIMAIPNSENRINIPFNDSMFLLELLRRPIFQERNPDSQAIIEFFGELFADSDKQIGDINAGDRIRNLLPQFPSFIPIAPLRSKPKRTYDPIREIPSPEGQHIPMLMMQLKHGEKKHWEALHDSLVRFGRESGMFSDINVKRHGKEISDPFQVQVKVRSGSPTNIMDVGYGVSQSLPILVDVLAAEKGLGQRNGANCTFVMQQPEVHLHPRAQAELASFFVHSYKNSGNRIMIETHSDHIIDRFRISVRTGLLNADDVSILYFEPKSRGVEIHSMSLDKYGNLIDAPVGYRSFFETEIDSLLGLKD